MKRRSQAGSREGVAAENTPTESEAGETPATGGPAAGATYTRRQVVAGALAGGALAAGLGSAVLAGGCGDSETGTTETYTLPVPEVPTYTPGTGLGADQMRISFMGTSFLPRVAQQCNSVFVELGNGDSFVFDYGSGVSSKYTAMGVTPARQTRVFITHLHGDHTSDLITLYCFGPSQDRKTPLHIYGPSGDSADEGTEAFCDNLHKLMKWHREAFSFLPTGLKDGQDGYTITPHELPYMKTGTAYDENGVRITHFPAVHDRNGSISYKLEWNGLSMVFAGDTRPNTFMLDNAKGVDVLVHEMVVPPDVWASKNSGLQPGDPGWDNALNVATEVQESSHTPELALGYILSEAKPRLGVGTHFQANDDTVPPAMDAIRTWYDGDFAIALDGFVITVSKDEITQGQVDFDEFAWYPPPQPIDPDTLAAPKYDGPYAQLNQTLLDSVIPEDVYTPASSASPSPATSAGAGTTG